MWGDNGPYGDVGFGPCWGHSFDVGIFCPYSPSNYVAHSKYSNYPDAFGNVLCGGQTLDKTNEDVPPMKRKNFERIKFDIECIETYRIDII